MTVLERRRSPNGGAPARRAMAHWAWRLFRREWSQLSERLTNVPAADLIVILVGLPVIAAIGGWLLSGRQPRGLSRRSLD
jgi:hypothetical protein